MVNICCRKWAGYYFIFNLNIKTDFVFSISVPLHAMVEQETAARDVHVEIDDSEGEISDDENPLYIPPSDIFLTLSVPGENCRLLPANTFGCITH